MKYEKYTVCGMEKIDYINKSNKRVEGLKLHCAYEDDTKCIGLIHESFYINGNFDKLLEEFQIGLGDVIEPLYNRYGNVQSIKYLKTGE